MSISWGDSLFLIGPYTIVSRSLLAPMAGVTDLPFRRLCRRLGAGLAASEMLTSDTRLWHSQKSSARLMIDGDEAPRAIQIAGSEPAAMAEAARAAVLRGAQIIDINMGCPAKKVCRKAAGSALLRDEDLVTDILQAVTAAADVPVTLKIRTGWSPSEKNALTIARIAEDCGIVALAVHGRTRACRFGGSAEYDTMAAIAQSVSIPVIANGDIDSPLKARQVLDYTGAAAVMVGRAAQGNPWIFQAINCFLETGESATAPSVSERGDLILEHLNALHDFYGASMGMKIARKHIGWYFQYEAQHEPQQDPGLTESGISEFRRRFNRLESTQTQKMAVRHYFAQRLIKEEIAA
jgi:tRNA-dihydrouridine synthase B